MNDDEERGRSFIEYRPGNVGIIISIPHGGLKDDSTIPERSDGFETSNNLQEINVLNQHNVSNINNNNKNIAAVNDSSNDKLQPDIISATKQTTKRCVNNNCLSITPNFSTTVKNATGKESVVAAKLAYKVTLSTDGWTIDLGEIMIKTILDCFGGSLKPHVIICHLKRTKVDMNRDVIEGSQGNPVATAAYKYYHECIKRAKSSSNRGILFDLHGQSHGKNTTELGYLLSRQSLNCRLYEPNKSSLRALAAENKEISGRDLIAGTRSFGALLEDEGYYAVPSPRQPFPGPDKYYSGGYITRSYGSYSTRYENDPSNESLFDAIQLETPRESRIDGGEEERTNYGKALGRVIVMFYRKYYYEELVQSLKMLG